jgi:hypothetical protein
LTRLKDRPVQKKREGNVTSPSQRYPSDVHGKFTISGAKMQVQERRGQVVVTGTFTLFLSYFEYTMYFGTTIRHYTLTQQYNHNVFLHTHTLYKSVGAAPPQHAANTSGGEFRSKIASSLHCITWRDAEPRPVSASCRSSLSVGIRPAPKT